MAYRYHPQYRPGPHRVRLNGCLSTGIPAYAVDVTVEGAEPGEPPIGFTVHEAKPGASEKRVTIERPGYGAVLCYTLPPKAKKAATKG